MVNKKNNSSNFMVFGRWQQTKSDEFTLFGATTKNNFIFLWLRMRIILVQIGRRCWRRRRSSSEVRKLTPQLTCSSSFRPVWWRSSASSRRPPRWGPTSRPSWRHLLDSSCRRFQFLSLDLLFLEDEKARFCATCLKYLTIIKYGRTSLLMTWLLLLLVIRRPPALNLTLSYKLWIKNSRPRWN